MKLSKTMLEHLRWMRDVQKSGLEMRRPGHYENLRTHNALVRRGLVAEEADGRSYVTAAGISAAG